MPKKIVVRVMKINDLEYVDLVKAAEILDRSPYRLRQMNWNGDFEDVRRKGRKIWILRSEVEELAQQRLRKENRWKGLRLKRRMSVVVKSAECMLEILSRDSLKGPDNRLDEADFNVITTYIEAIRDRAKDQIQDIEAI